MRLLLAIALAALASAAPGCKDGKSELEPAVPGLPDEPSETDDAAEGSTEPSGDATASPDAAAGPARENDRALVERDAGPPPIVVPEVVE